MFRDRYYAQKLSADRLHRVYEIATPRVRRYLEAEIEFVLTRLQPDWKVLELGCGYGRLLEPLIPAVALTVGIDNSFASIEMAVELLGGRCRPAVMDAGETGFANAAFDAVVCLQNGISAFKVEPLRLLRESARIARPGGLLFFSSYSPKFWRHRLEWFELQAAEGLLGEIDRDKTGDGVIVCKDGFRATTFTADDFSSLAGALGLPAEIREVDESSVICTITIPGQPRG